MLSSSLNNVNTQALLNITDIYNLKQLINEPTRVTPVSSTLIDVIFTSHPDNVSCSGVSHVGISDHSLIYVFRKISLPSAVRGNNTVSYRQFKNFNRNRFRSDILAQPWADLMGMDNPNEMWSKWKALFLEVCDLHAPLHTKYVRASKSPWITPELKNLMYRRDRLKIKALRTGDPSDWNNFKRLRNEVNNAIKNVKKSYYYKTFEVYNGNSRKTWETINEVTRRKSDKAVINELELNGTRITNSTEIAEGFNNFFAEIGPELSRDIEEVGTSFDEYIHQTSNCFSFQRVTQSHVLSYLNKLCKRKATGLDSVSARLLRDHSILLSKLQAYGIQGSTNQWFCSYLKNRTQTCLVNGNKSSKMFLRCGVPQGTILGPLLFLLYINDLPNCLQHSQPRMYADDTSITFAGSDVDEINNCINLDLERIRVWLAANRLTLNMTKTEFLLIGSKQRLSNFTVNPTANINQFPIKRVSTVKSLGVHIDENLTWECHINELSKKIASGISAIKRIRYSVPYKTLLSIYNSLVQPHLDYCSSVWGSCSKSLSQKLQKLQNRAARVITFSNYDRNTDELLRMVNWVKLDRQRLVNKSIMMYKIVNNMVPEYLSSHFVLRSDTLTYNLRDSDGTLAIPQPRTNYCKRSLSYSGVVLWNSLPLNTRQSLSLNEFKSKLKNYDFDSGLI